MSCERKVIESKRFRSKATRPLGAKARVRTRSIARRVQSEVSFGTEARANGRFSKNGRARKLQSKPFLLETRPWMAEVELMTSRFTRPRKPAMKQRAWMQAQAPKQGHGWPR